MKTIRQLKLLEFPELKDIVEDYIKVREDLWLNKPKKIFRFDE